LVGSFLRIQYIVDVDGYEIKEHPDVETKLFTLQTYFPEKEDDDINLGTQLFDQNKRIVKVVKYLKNTGYFFFPSNSEPITWHGFLDKKIKHKRHSILINYFRKDHLYDQKFPESYWEVK
jgi:hypothetical protein